MVYADSGVSPIFEGSVGVISLTCGDTVSATVKCMSKEKKVTEKLCC